MLLEDTVDTTLCLLEKYLLMQNINSCSLQLWKIFVCLSRSGILLHGFL